MGDNAIRWLVILIVLCVVLVILFKWVLPLIFGSDADTALMLPLALAGRVFKSTTTIRDS